MRTAVRLFIFTAILFLAAAANAMAPQDQSFGFRLTQWNQTFSEISLALEREGLERQKINELRDGLAQIRREAQEAKKGIEGTLSPLKARLDALGAPPAEGEPEESPDVVAQRASLNEEIAAYEGQIKQAELTITRADEMDGALSEYIRERQVEELLTRNPFPLAPSTIAVAVPEFFRHLGELARAPVEWWRRLSPDQQDQILLNRIGLIAFLAIAIGITIRLFLLRWFGRDPTIEHPSYARRLAAAVAVGVASGIVPALIFGGILFVTVARFTLLTGLFEDIVISFCVGMIIFVLACALPRAALAPRYPNWSLESIAPENARTINRWITMLAAVFAIDIFFIGSTKTLAISEQLDSLYFFVTDSIEAVLILALMRGRLWTLTAGKSPDESAASEEGEDEEQRPSRRSRIWKFLRIVISTTAVAGIIASAAGYAFLGSFLIKSLLASGVVAGLLFTLRGLLRELIGVALRSVFVHRQLGLRHPTRQLLKFWLRALIDLTFLILGLVLILPLWGVPPRDILAWTERVLEGVTVGNVTISIIDVVAGLGVFVLTIVITRMIQRVLSERVLPQTTLESGLQHSLSAGFGYIGIILAATLGVAALGLDLSNIALIAGALSVGIGFGLQNIVNNFVSGMILLAERPIQVGDWIIASGHEGYVKQINVRATELETFQRASVIIPNSELLSTSVVNWTHKNKIGRIEVPVRVEYGSDIEKVMDILEDCLRQDSRILMWPEPFVLFRDFGESALQFEARGFIGNIEYVFVVGSDLRVAIDRAFREHGITIPFPQQDLHLKDIDRLADALGNHAPSVSEPIPAEPAPRPAIVSARTTGMHKSESRSETADGEGDGDG